MSNNLKDLIDKAEKEERTNAELQKTIDKLKLENSALKKKLGEDKEETKHIKISKKSFQPDSEEIESLKTIITSQREQLTDKEQKIKNIESKLTSLQTNLKNSESLNNNVLNEQAFIQTKEALDNLVEEYGRLENKNLDLIKKLKDLDDANIALKNKVKVLEDVSKKNVQIEKSISLIKAENDTYHKENEAMKADIKTLRSELSTFMNFEQEYKKLDWVIKQKDEEMKILQDSLNEIKNENVRLKAIETSIPKLKAEINRLKKEEDTIKEKDTILLAKTITAMSSQEKTKLSKPSIAQIKQEDKHNKLKVQEPVLFKETKTLDSSKVNKASSSESNKEKVSIPQPQKSIQDLIAEEISNGTSSDLIIRKWQCPNCGNIDKSKIREIPDKSRIIYGSLYGKKYKCGLCAAEWR